MFEQERSKVTPILKSVNRTEVFDALVGRCDVFKVVSVIASGAFLYCGIEKDLFVPVGEQYKIMKEGETHLVYVYRDEQTGRIAGSSKLNKYLYDEAPKGMRDGDEVDLIIYAPTDMGYKAVVNNDSWGVLYKNEVFQDLQFGQKISGYVKKVRPDGRIDLCLQKPGFQSVPDLSEKILEHLKVSGGSCPFTDKTPPEEIYRLFGVSKKKFKMAVGTLYKKRKIFFESESIQLTEGAQKRKQAE